MSRAILSTTLAVAIISPGSASADVHMKWMGQLSCGAWPKNASHTAVEKAATLNWVLGYLSRGAVAKKSDILGHVDQASVSAWLDRYCNENPLDDIPVAASALELELLARSAR